MRLVRREIDPAHDAGLPASSGPRDRFSFRLEGNGTNVHSDCLHHHVVRVEPSHTYIW